MQKEGWQMDIYVTVQGDMWDSIAKKVYGTETAMDALMKANLQYLNMAVFGAGVEMNLPQLTAQKAEPAIVPPWRK